MKLRRTNLKGSQRKLWAWNHSFQTAMCGVERAAIPMPRLNENKENKHRERRGARPVISKDGGRRTLRQCDVKRNWRR
jgi:hypothetical protein